MHNYTMIVRDIVTSYIIININVVKQLDSYVATRHDCKIIPPNMIEHLQCSLYHYIDVNIISDMTWS